MPLKNYKYGKRRQLHHDGHSESGKKIPELTDGEETVSETDRTKTKPHKIKSTAPNNAESEEDEDYQPTPNTNKSPPYETGPPPHEKEQGEEEDDIDKPSRTSI